VLFLPSAAVSSLLLLERVEEDAVHMPCQTHSLTTHVKPF
jgi:hypothetical protein